MSDEMKLLSMLVQTGLYKKKDRHGKLIQGRNIPGMLVGRPGIGKTQIVTALGEEIGKKLCKKEGDKYPVEIFVAPQRMPEEVGGIPVPFYEQEEVKCLPMSIGKKLLAAGQGIFAVDEYSSASQAMGGACMTAIQDGRLGDLQMPSSVARLAMMNPADCAANGRLLTAPESNRFCWINWEVTLADWVDYMQGGRGTLSDGVILPETWELDFGMQATGTIVSYLNKHPAVFDVAKTMPKAHDASKPWTSPRSLENAARLLAACQSVGENPASDLASLALRGVLGEGQADSFLQWYVEMDLPDPEELLADWKSAITQLDGMRPDKLQVAMESLATTACIDHKSIEKRWETAWKIVGPTLQTAPDNALYAAKILANSLQKVPGAETPKEAALVGLLLKKSGVK